MSDSVLFDVLHTAGGANFGVATLNAEKTLNSLSLPMIESLDAQLREWQTDDSIALVIIEGAGDRAFSAGGDIQDLYRSMADSDGGPNEYAERFFEHEYRLDYLIHQYDKPVIAWANGIVMGGGLGVMAAASHRIGTENARIAMPEISIGLFPDAGATWFLANMPLHLAHFIAWTGCELNAEDAKRVGLVDRLVRHGDKDKLMDKLRGQSWRVSDDNHAKLDELLPNLTQQAARFPESLIEEHEIDIASVVGSAMSAERPAIAFAELLEAFDEDEWLSKAAATFRAGSTTTAHLIPEQIHRARGLDLRETFMQELSMALQCTMHPDFCEGVRARIIDRDNKPAWQFASLAEVPEDWVMEHFDWPLESEHVLADLPEPK